MVYTAHLLQQLQAMLVQHLPCWGLAADCAVALVTVSENATFAVTGRDGRRYILRLYRPGYHDDAEILSELHWMQALAQTDIIRIPCVYPTVAGALLVVRNIAGQRWRMACFDYLPGAMPCVNDTLPPWFAQLGAITARLHGHSRIWQKPRGFRRKHWTYATMVGPHAYWGDWRQAGPMHPSAYSLLQRCDQFLKAQAGRLSAQDADYMLLHGDLRLANLLIDRGRLSVIDFDDCGFSWPALDFANAVSFMEDDPLVPELQRAWLGGYESVAPPSKTLVASLDLFIMMRRMQLTAWLASHAETPTALELGEKFISGTVALAENFLARSSPVRPASSL